MPLVSTYDIPPFPGEEIETSAVLKATSRAARALAELKGRAATIPNQGILIDTLSLQEAKASSEIEDIVTTQDDLFRGEATIDRTLRGPVKEVALYRDALRLGWDRVVSSQGVLTNNTLVEQFRLLKGRADGFRTTAGTALKNGAGEVIYVPPQRAESVVRHMTALERFVNDDEASALDPLVKVALIHHQFESIHPFPDGNGRVGRMLNVLYLTRSGLLDTPILYLSRYINQNKAAYYHLLQAVRDADEEARPAAWEAWVLYMVGGIEETSIATLALVRAIREQMATMKSRLRDGELRRIYSQDLLNNLFRHPYTRIEFVQDELNVSRGTATSYLNKLAEAGFVVKRREGRNNYYVNVELVRLFLDGTEARQD